MTSLTKNSDTIDIDDILGSLKYTFDQPNDILKLPQPLIPQTSSPLPSPENNSQPIYTDETNSKSSNNKSGDSEIILLKSRINELETQLADLNTRHQRSIEQFSELNVTYLENQNAELRYNLTQKVQTINELTTEIEALENMLPESRQPSECEARLKELEEQNSTLLAENLSYDMQTSEMKEQMNYRDKKIERLKLELTNQQRVNDELNDQISVQEIQLANWQIDFQKEREDRAALAGDRDTILTQLKYAQCREEPQQNSRHIDRRRQSDCLLM